MGGPGPLWDEGRAEDAPPAPPATRIPVVASSPPRTPPARAPAASDWKLTPRSRTRTHRADVRVASLDPARHAGGLVEREALDGPPARHENPVEPVFATANAATALTVCVDGKSHPALKLGKGLRVGPDLQPRPWWPHAVTGAPANPPAASQL